MKLIRQYDEYNEKIYSFWVICNILSLLNFKQFECVCYKQVLVWFFCIVYHKIRKHLIKSIKNYRYTYIKGIFIINFEYIQIMSNLSITYVIIFNKLTK